MSIFTREMLESTQNKHGELVYEGRWARGASSEQAKSDSRGAGPLYGSFED